jgi:hypothetical protein
LRQWCATWIALVETSVKARQDSKVVATIMIRGDRAQMLDSGHARTPQEYNRMKRQMQEREEMITVPPHTAANGSSYFSICLLAACSKVTAENYAKIKAGMSYKEVSGILRQSNELR